MSLVVPTQPVPSQTLAVTLANQAVKLQIDQKSTGMFMSVYVNDALIIGGVICQNLNRIVRDAYLGFIGDFIWADTQPSNPNDPTTGSDPYYTGLGSQFQLIYLEVADLREPA